MEAAVALPASKADVWFWGRLLLSLRSFAKPGKRAEEKRAQCRLLRCIFGPRPFRPPRIDVSWLAWGSGAAVRIARAIYDQQRWADLPVLGDALEETGCTDAEILGHCRGSDHARGCWLIDLLLERVGRE
jgi:hypothetical protein